MMELAAGIDYTQVIPEDVFKDVILPCVISGLAGQTDVDLSMWMKIAGDPRLPIKVVSNRNKDELLFIVPPIWATVVPKILTHPKDTMSDVVLKTAELSVALPMIGKKHWDSRIQQKLDDIDLAHNASWWDVIFKRYGIDMHKLANGESGGETPVNVAIASPVSKTAELFDPDDFDEL